MGKKIRINIDVLAAVSDTSQKFVVRLDGLAGATPKEMFNNAVSRGRMAEATGNNHFQLRRAIIFKKL